MSKEAQKLIETLGLQAHPEGGYFKETYRSSEIIPQPIGNFPVYEALDVDPMIEGGNRIVPIGNL